MGRPRNGINSIVRGAYDRAKRAAENDQNKNKEWKLTYEEYREIITSPCVICGNPGDRKYTKNYTDGTSETYYINSCDRIDSDGIYETSNCQTLCWGCNKRKSTSTDEEFITNAFEVVRYQTSIYTPYKNIPLGFLTDYFMGKFDDLNYDPIGINYYSRET